MDARDYLSGTHYEYLEALQSHQQVGKPTVWLYRCAEEPSLKLSDPKQDENIQQFDRVLQFFKQFQDWGGAVYRLGELVCRWHGDFKALMKGKLLTYLRHRRDMPTPPIPPKIKLPVIRTGDPLSRAEGTGTKKIKPIFFGRDAETLEVLRPRGFQIGWRSSWGRIRER